MRAVTKGALRKLRRMGWRTVAIALVISLALGMMVAGFYGADVMEESIHRFFDDSLMPDVFVGLSNRTNASAVEAAIAARQDAAAHELRLRIGGAYVREGETLPATLIGVERFEGRDICLLDLLDGSYPAARGQAVALSGLEGVGVKPGAQARFQVAGREVVLNLTGLVRSPEYVFASAYAEYTVPLVSSLVVVYMPLGDLQDIAGGGINDVIALMADGDPGSGLVAALEPFGIDSVTYKASHPSLAFMEIGAHKLRNMFPLMGVIFLFIGFVSIFMTMMRLVQTDSRHIGVTMALGYTRRAILASYLYLGTVLWAIGAALGTVFALGFAAGFVKAGMSLYMNVDLVLPFRPWPFLIGLAFTAATVLVSVGVPVLLIVRSSVREALEYRPPVRVWTARARPARVSRTTLMGARNVVRTPGRTAVTVVVVGLTIATAGMWLFLLDSTVDYMRGQVEASTWDMRADFGEPVPTANVTAGFLDLAPGETEYVVPFAHLTVVATHGAATVSAVAVGSDDIRETSEWPVNQGELDFGGAVVSNKLATDLGVRPGDHITLAIGPATAELEVKAVLDTGFVSAVYTDRANLDALFPPGMSTGAFVRLVDHNAVDVAAEAVRANPVVTHVVEQEEIAENLEGLLSMAGSFMSAFFLMSALITIAVAGSAVIISTMERDVEYATLDTLGIPRGRVAAGILVEMGALGLMASAVGIPLSFVLAKMLAAVLREVLFYFPVVLVAGAAVMTFVMGVAFVMLSSIMPIRYASGLDTETTLRERTAG